MLGILKSATVALFGGRRKGAIMQKAIRLTEWQIHVQGCDACQSVNIEATKTLSNVCNAGAPLLRDELSRLASKNRARPERDPDEKRPTLYVVREKYTVTEIDPKTKKPQEIEKQRTISPIYERQEIANDFLALAKKTMGGDPARFFISEH